MSGNNKLKAEWSYICVIHLSELVEASVVLIYTVVLFWSDILNTLNHSDSESFLLYDYRLYNNFKANKIITANVCVISRTSQFNFKLDYLGSL